jgi:hypothetical protein
MNQSTKYFLLGISTILFGASYLYVQERKKQREIEYKKRKFGRSSGASLDAENLSNDWQSLGKDLSSAIKKYKVEK